MSRILIVEDDIAISSQLSFALESRYSADVCMSFADVRSLADVNAYDIALVDLGLPPAENTYTEGLKVIDYLTENSRCKIIILTGQGGSETAMACLMRGCFDFLTKPVQMDQLLFSIDRAELFVRTEQELKNEGIEKITLSVKMGEGLQDIREQAEKNLVLKVISDCGYNIYKAAKVLGVKRESLYYFMKKFGIERKSDD